MSNGKQNPALQGGYLSENTAQGDFYTILITFADYDSGHIEGLWGKNHAPANPLGSSGYHRLEASNESTLTFEFDGDISFILLSKDQNYKRLSGQFHSKQSGSTTHVVFNRS
ncbi:hypothetical protein HX823_04800 [Pseudomonas sp. P7759]|uniref:hypothetical protein n=1 Tax=Pseudomonas sp. P7759 TaxID=2738831 RepID=UPI0015A237A5|nr:hypothetical protein [Pseudomonas sp. P7759]NWC73393.1 hypothetical protein [Pseudomonas sp. P7759]